jgi:hypothetical protein
MTHAMSWAAEIGAELMPVHTGSLKKWATGKGNASKEEMMAVAVGHGITPVDDNEADAFLLLSMAAQQLKV